MSSEIKILLFLVAFAFFLWRSAGKRWFKLTFRTWWFLLSRPPVFVTSIVCTIAAGVLLHWSATAEGHDPTANVMLFGGISLVCGVGAACLLVPPVFFARRLMTEKPSLELPEGETVTLELPGNHWLAGESRGGTLHVTERALHFVPSRFSVQLAQWSLPLEEIAELEEAGARLLVIHDASAAEHLIVLQERAQLAERLSPAA